MHMRWFGAFFGVREEHTPGLSVNRWHTRSLGDGTTLPQAKDVPIVPIPVDNTHA